LNQLTKHWPHDSDWTPILEPYFKTDAWKDLDRFVSQQREQTTVYPAPENVFRAFETPGFEETKVVILGQDPYHRPGQAHGLSFSVEGDCKLPGSLRNIYQELADDLGVAAPTSGNLDPWARQGVFLLNSVLTVNSGQPQSHAEQGWELFTDHVITTLSDHPIPLVFVLWGKPAEAKSPLINKRHTQIISSQPSPLSAWRSFKGSKLFSRSNEALQSFGREPVKWEF
jgi:uracil-DNA glycosylase